MYTQMDPFLTMAGWINIFKYGYFPIYLMMVQIHFLLVERICMGHSPIKLSKSACKFIKSKGIEDVTFKLLEFEVSGCCVGIVKEIEQVYTAPKDASQYRYYRADSCHVFVSRKIKIVGPLKLTTEGVWNKRLFLSGTTVPV